MRPLPSATGPGQGSEFVLAEAPLSTLRGQPGSFVPERLAGSITRWGRWEGCVWLRVPAGRDNLAEALTAACRHRWWPDADPSDDDHGATDDLLADTIRRSPPGAVVVLELPGRVGRGVGRLLARLNGLAVDRSLSVITVVESHLPFSGQHSGPTRRMAELIDPAAIGGAEALDNHGRLLLLAGRRAAVVQDVVDATTIWPVDAVATAVEQSTFCRGLVDQLNRALLPLCEPAQLDALEVCLATGFWHPRFGTHAISAAQLRPWVVPLEDDWGWLRPIWARSLRRHLVDRPLVLHGQPPVARLESTARVSTPRIEARLLGTFELRVDGRPIETWRGRRGISVLRYLLMRERLNCPRDELLAEFWPDVRPEVARNRLQVAVSGLRKTLAPVTGAPLIEYADGCYRLNRDIALEVDVKQFEAALGEARGADQSTSPHEAVRAYRRAVARYHGDFAADAPYEQWTLLPRENLRIRYIEALDRLARLLLENNDLDECIAIGHRMLEVDPCREDAHRLLMRCYTRQGRVYQALRQYEFCCRVLSATIETEPAAQTTQLYRTIMAGPQRAAS